MSVLTLTAKQRAVLDALKANGPMSEDWLRITLETHARGASQTIGSLRRRGLIVRARDGHRWELR